MDVSNFYFLTQYSKGKMVILGSVHMLSDQYLDKEENAKVQVSEKDSDKYLTGSKTVFLITLS